MHDEPGSAPEASIVVATYNDAEFVSRTVDSLLDQSHPSYEIVIVNDGSDDNTPAVLEKYRREPKVRLIDLAQNHGVPGARNAGIRAARGKILAFTDSDAIAPRDWLENLVRPFQGREEVCTGGPDRVPDSDGFFSRCVDFTLRSIIATGNLRRQTPFARYTPGGYNLAIHRDTLKKSGLFDERLNRRGEEKELIQRIRRQGVKILYVPEAMIWHHRRFSPSSFWRQTYLSGKARVDILRLAPDALEPAHIFPALLAMALVISALGLLVWPRAHFFALPLVFYCSLVLFNGTLAGIRLGHLKAIPITAMTTVIVHFAYGLGLLVRLVQRGAYTAVTDLKNRIFRHFH